MTDYIETAGFKDKAALNELFDKCFPGEQGFSRWFFDNMWQSSNTLLIRYDGKIISALQMLPLELEHKGETMRGCYIFAVGTDPSFEGKGCAGALLKKSFKICKDNGLVFSALIVQQSSLINYYSRFGYEPIFKVQRINVPANPACGSIVPLDSSHIEVLDRIYRQSTNDMLFDARSFERWQQQIEAYKVYGYQKDGEITSYCFADNRMDGFFAAEACGEDAIALVSGAAYKQGKTRAQLLTVCDESKPSEAIGCFLPLSAKAEEVKASSTVFYLNLYYN